MPTQRPVKIRRIAVGSDHGGFHTKEKIKQDLRRAGYVVVDVGTHSEDSTDYPDYALSVARAVVLGRCQRGVLVCGTGIGMCIMANKVKGIRAANPWSVETAKLASEHNWSNILCVSGRFLPVSLVKKMVKTWISTPWDLTERHTRRIKKILKLESKR